MKTSKRIKRLFLRLSIFCGILAAIVAVFFYCTRGPISAMAFSGTKKVAILKKDGRYTFIKGQQPFFVKGAAGYTHIKELAASGGNTIICWDTSRIAAVLDEALYYKVAVIVGLDIPGGEQTIYYKKNENAAKLLKAYEAIVKKYKDHPALLAWCLGNELELPLSFSVTPFFKSYNNLLTMMHTTDPDHPVSTTVINVPKKGILNLQWRIPAFDFICINTYNKLKTIERDLNTIKLFWNGPYLISEWAPNGGWEADATTWGAPIENTSTKKAEQYQEFYAKHLPAKDPRYLGAMAFYWGNRQEYTYTWYSIFNDDDTPTEIKETLTDYWKGSTTKHIAPRLEYMMVDGLGAKENVIVSAGSSHQATVRLDSTCKADSLRYAWQILKEDWQYWGQTWNNFKKPAPGIILQLQDSTQQRLSFTTPLKEGPYRVFVTVYNSKGYCATANTPIYVIE